MSKSTRLIYIGIGLYAIVCGIDRFITEIPDLIYSPIAVIAVVLVIVGFIKSRKPKQKKAEVQYIKKRQK